MVTLFYINTHSCLLTILPRVPDLTSGKKVIWSLSFYDSLRPEVFSQEFLHGCIEGYGKCHLLLWKCTKYYVQITQNIIYIYIYIFMLKRNFIEEDDSTNIILEFSLSRLLLLLKMSKTVFFWVARIRK